MVHCIKVSGVEDAVWIDGERERERESEGKISEPSGLMPVGVGKLQVGR